MRSIGAWKIKKLKKIVDEVCTREAELGNHATSHDCRDKIKAQIPDDWYETWECAWSEINRLVDDFTYEWRPL